MSHAWTEPTAERVSSGVHRIPLPMPEDGLQAVNVYAIDDGARITLVDGGCADAASRSALTTGLAAMGARLTDVRQVLVTHAHRDHYPQAVLLRRDVGAAVRLGALEAASVTASADGAVSPVRAHLDLLRRAGAEALADVIEPLSMAARDTTGWADPDSWLADGDLLALTGRTLRVETTPGHTQGHVVFRDDAAGLLFSGDHVLPEITPSIGFESAIGSLPLQRFLDSLLRLRAEPDARLLPAHGPVTDSVHSRVDTLLAHHDQRLADAAGHVRGPVSGYDVARRMTWTSRRRTYDEIDPFNQMLAVNETVAHLDLLVHRGTLAVEDGLVRRYSPA